MILGSSSGGPGRVLGGPRGVLEGPGGVLEGVLSGSWDVSGSLVILRAYGLGVLGRLGSVLGSSWVPLWPLWASLGLLLGPLEALLGPSWDHFGHFK